MSEPHWEIEQQGKGGLSVFMEALSAAERPRWRIHLRAGEEGFVGTVALRWSFSAPTVPWFLFPGFFYGQGKTDDRLHYPALGSSDKSDWHSPRWQFALDRGAYPVLLCWQEEAWQGLDWSPHYSLTGGPSTPRQWGDSEPQIGLGLAWEKGEGELSLHLPANEAPRRHARNRHDSPTEKVLQLDPGQTLSFTVGQWAFPGDRHGYQKVLETVYHELNEHHPVAEPVEDETLAWAACAGLLNWHWQDDPGYMVYTTAYDRSTEFNANNKGGTLGWHFESLGFVGGFPVIFGLQWHDRVYGDPKVREVVQRYRERFLREGQSEWGFFRTSYHPGEAATPNGKFPNPAGVGYANQDPTGKTPFYGSCWQEKQSILHARTTADASFYLARSLALDEPQPCPEGLAALRRSLEAALSLQDKEGRFGQLYDLEKRGVAQSEGAGGLLWITALHHAEPLFREADPAWADQLVAAMDRAGEGYARDIEEEYICGAPEDVSLAPTSEDGYNAIMAYAALHRRFGRDKDQQRLQRAADWTLTWRKAMNVYFPPRSMLGSFGFRTRGGDFASSNNNHLHLYGLNCLSDLFYLSKLTGSAYYAERAWDNWCFSGQLLVTETGQWNGQIGMCSEQYYTNDWSIWGTWDPTAAHVQKGTFMGMSHVWCVNMILLGLEQISLAKNEETLPGWWPING
ncbi:MAG: hypothetical protein LAT58_10400 [Opitutales bacterium]|nr:hypothetical protein [Opitutales bacterium]